MSQHEAIPLDKFDAELKSGFVEVSSAALGAKVLSASDDFFVSRHNLIKPTPSVSMKGQFGPNGALYDAWETRRHNPNFDWVIIKLAPHLSKISYVDIDTSHFSGNEAPMSQVFGLRLGEGEASAPKFRLSAKDPRWTEILPVVELGPNSRHIFRLASEAREGEWGALMVRMIPDGGMARFRAYGLPTPPTPLAALPAPSVEATNLLDPLLGARIISCSDANFSPPGNLLLPTRGVDMSDGWETRRSQHNRGKYAPGQALHGKERCEWVVARLAGTGVIRCVDVDTAYHPGNYPVACKVEAILSDEDLPSESAQWTEIVSKKPLGPHRQHWFDVERSVAPDQVFSHVRLTTFPDGGLKRLRIYGHPIAPSAAAAPSAASASSGPFIPALPITVEAFKPYGDVIQGFDIDTSAPKGIDVTIANQGTAFKFHRLAKIAETYPAGSLVRGGVSVSVARQEAIVETANGAEVRVETLERHAATTQAFIPMGKTAPVGTEQLAPGGACLVVVALNGADDKPDLSTLRAFLALSSQGISYHAGVWHHSKLTFDAPMDYAYIEARIGEPGLKLDCEKYTPPQAYCTVVVPPYTDKSSPIGKPTDHSSVPASSAAPAHASAPHGHSLTETLTSLLPSSIADAHPVGGANVLHPTPITAAAFAPFGSLIRAYPHVEDRGAGVEFHSLPYVKTEKYARLAPVLSSYPADADAYAGINLFRATKKVGLERGKVFDVKILERHPYTSQAFIPMGKGSWKDKGEPSLPAGGAFLVVVAKNGPDDRPDPSTLQSFVMESSMGLSYAPGVWHHPVLVLDTTLDLACVETQVSTGVRDDPDARDCELIELPGDEVYGRIAVPGMVA